MRCVFISFVLGYIAMCFHEADIYLFSLIFLSLSSALRSCAQTLFFNIISPEWWFCCNESEYFRLYPFRNPFQPGYLRCDNKSFIHAKFEPTLPSEVCIYEMFPMLSHRISYVPFCSCFILSHFSVYFCSALLLFGVHTIFE